MSGCLDTVVNSCCPRLFSQEYFSLILADQWILKLIALQVIWYKSCLFCYYSNHWKWHM